MKEYPFYTAYTQVKEFYGLSMNPDEFETIGLVAWDKIGNKRYKLYKLTATPSVTDDGVYYVELPCNADYIEAVVADYEDYQKTTPSTRVSNNQSGWIESYIESRKFNTNFLYTSGKFIKYTQEDNRLILADKFNTVFVLYKGILADEEGLPSITDTETDAIAAFCAYTDAFKKALVARDQVTMQFAQLLEQKWLKKCTQARVPDHISQNDLDEILNVSTSWDRKRFGKSYKPIR